MKYFDPMKETPEGELLNLLKSIEESLGIKKNTECMGCKSSDQDGCEECNPVKKADMGEKDKYCKKHFGCKYSECSAKQKAQCDRECGKPSELKKYQVEPDGTSTVPSFMEVSGSEKIRAHGFGTNQTIPNMNDGKARSPISEVFKMPAVAQTGYDTNSSSLHMHYNDGGTGGSMYRDKIEESMMTIKKQSTHGQLGLIEEIAGLIEQVYARL